MSAQSPVMVSPAAEPAIRESHPDPTHEPVSPEVVSASSAAPSPSTATPADSQPKPERLSTVALITQMLQSAPKTSDLIFSPGRAPMVEVNGQLRQLKIEGIEYLKPDDTARIAADLIGRNAIAVQKLKDEGSADISFSIPKLSRFRVNIFTQRGTCAVVMRVIASSVPTFTQLNLPAELTKVAELRNGIVLVTGPTGSGKSSTLAAIVNQDQRGKGLSRPHH